MLDIKLFRDNPDIVRKDLKKRGDSEKLAWVEDLIAKDKEWGQLKFELQNLQHKRNQLTQDISRLKKEGKDFSGVVAEAKEIPAKMAGMEKDMEALREKIDFYLMRLPNILHESVPVGKDDTENQVVRLIGNKPEFSFTPKSHVDVIESMGLVDLDRAAKISGARFFFLKGDLFLMELALRKFAIDSLLKKGFVPVEPPFMMRRKPYEGVTDLSDFENVMYKVDGEDLYLIATSEHPLTAMFQDEVLDESLLPLKFTGLSTNFRKEAGSHGKDTKGIFRVHQFNKIEQIVLCRPEDSWKFHEEMIKNAEELFSAIGLHCRIVNICTGDIGTVAAKKYDIEAWMPSQGTYREVVSCSNCTDYQARRLNIKATDGKDRYVIHTLNSTAIATSRALVAILENFQNADGTVTVPEVLRQYMGGIDKLRPLPIIKLGKQQA